MPEETFFDPMNWTPDQEPRVVVFFFEAPDPILLPNGTTFSVSSDRKIVWLEGLKWKPVREANYWPEEWSGHLFVSFRFWQGTSTVPTPLPSDALMATIKLVMPPEKQTPTTVGLVGLDDEYELELDEDELEDKDVEEEDLEEDEQDDGSWDDKVEPKIRDSLGEEGFEWPVTVIEAVTPLLPSESGASPIIEALHRCANDLAEITRVYRLANKIRMHPLTYERLPSVVFWATRNLFNEEKNIWDDRFELMIFPMKMPGRTHHEPLAQEEMDRFKAHYESFRYGNPMIPYSERTLDARLAFDVEGDYINCVIQCQTAMEVLLDGLLALMLWEEEKPPEEAAEMFEAKRLHERVRTYFPPRLGGDWNTKKGKGMIARWAQVLVPLRNRVVHSAYSPRRGEAGEALEIVSLVDGYFRKRLIEKRNVYKRVTLMVLGKPGLERYGMWSGKIKRFAEEEADQEPRWDESFGAWHDDVISIRQAFPAD